MTAFSNDLKNMIFRRNENKNIGEFTIDNQMLTILISLDGKKTFSEIVSQTGIPMTTAGIAVSRLQQMGLIVPLENAEPILDKPFIKYLKLQLSQIVGPIADILIEEAASTLGYSPMKVPRHRAAEWVDLLAREISDASKRIVFTKNMIGRISGQD